MPAEPAGASRRADGLAVHVKRDAFAFLEYPRDVGPLPKRNVRGADYRQAPIAASDIEAHLAAVADAEKEAGRLPTLLLQQRCIVERVGPSATQPSIVKAPMSRGTRDAGMSTCAAMPSS